jgi:hypothetical protein
VLFLYGTEVHENGAAGGDIQGLRLFPVNRNANPEIGSFQYINAQSSRLVTERQHEFILVLDYFGAVFAFEIGGNQFISCIS